MNRETFQEYINHSVESRQESLEEWKDKFVNDPVHALEWGENMMRDAVSLEEFQLVQHCLSQGKTGSETLEFMKDRMNGWMRDGFNNSTSAISNMVQRDKAAAAWKWLEPSPFMKTGVSAMVERFAQSETTDEG